MEWLSRWEVIKKYWVSILGSILGWILCWIVWFNIGFNVGVQYCVQYSGQYLVSIFGSILGFIIFFTFLMEILFLQFPQRKKTNVPILDILCNTLLHVWQVCVFGKTFVSWRNFIWDFWSLTLPINLPRFILTLLYIMSLLKSAIWNIVRE